jgi:hypothetical protein
MVSMGTMGENFDGGWQQEVVRVQAVGSRNLQEVDSSSCKNSSVR